MFSKACMLLVLAVTFTGCAPMSMTTLNGSGIFTNPQSTRLTVVNNSTYELHITEQAKVMGLLQPADELSYWVRFYHRGNQRVVLAKAYADGKYVGVAECRVRASTPRRPHQEETCVVNNRNIRTVGR